MTLDFDPREKRLVRQFASLGGTTGELLRRLVVPQRAAGSRAKNRPRGLRKGTTRPHGYAFYVPASADRCGAALSPLKAMGRFRQEAAVADARGIVYRPKTPRNTSGFYRFTPDRPGDLRAGKLQMLAHRGRSGRNAVRRGSASAHGSRSDGSTSIDPDPDLEVGAPSCFQQARARGGAAFNRLEGIFRGEDGRSIYFVSTSGGDRRGPSRDGLRPALALRAGDRRHGKQDELVLGVRIARGQRARVARQPVHHARAAAILFCEDDAHRRSRSPIRSPAASSNVNRLVGLGRRAKPFHVRGERAQPERVRRRVLQPRRRDPVRERISATARRAAA